MWSIPVLLIFMCVVEGIVITQMVGSIDVRLIE